jgi:hypothetical protein
LAALAKAIKRPLCRPRARASPMGGVRRARARAFLRFRRRARGGQKSFGRRLRRTPPAREARPAHTRAVRLNPLPTRSLRPRKAPPRAGSRGHRHRHLSRGRRHARRKRRAKKILVAGRRVSLRSPLSSRARSLRSAACVRHWRAQRGGRSTPRSGSRTVTGQPRRVPMNRRTFVRKPGRMADTAARGAPPLLFVYRRTFAPFPFPIRTLSGFRVTR